MRYDFNENDFGGRPIEGWAQVHDGKITDFGVAFGPNTTVPEWLQEGIREAFEKALPDLIEARQRGEADERDDREYHYRVDEPAQRRF